MNAQASKTKYFKFVGILLFLFAVGFLVGHFLLPSVF